MLAGMPARRPTEVVLEVTDRKAFASAVDWPGWCRSGKTPAAALEALADYAERYAVVARLASSRPPRPTGRCG
jgi:predicted RNase H-like HicB family nuclease